MDVPLKARLCLSSVTDSPDAAALAAFTEREARGGLLKRNEAVLAEAVELGVMVAIVGSAGEINDPDNILAIAGVLPLQAGLFELGGALVGRSHTGFGLQKPMLEARMAAFFGLNIAPLENLRTGAGRASYGDPSRRVLEASGFEPMRHEDTPIEFQDECKVCTRGAPDGHTCCYQFYAATQACRAVTYKPGVRETIRKSDGRTLRLTLPELNF